MTKATRDAQEGKQVEIFGQQVTRIEYRGHHVVTFAMIDKLHGRLKNTANNRFNENRDRFILNEDFFELTGHEIRDQSLRSIFPARTSKGTFITRRGYLKIVKSLNDDKAWDVFGDMIDRYFIVEEVIKAVASEFQAELDLDQSDDSLNFFRQEVNHSNSEITKHLETTKMALLGYFKKAMAPSIDALKSRLADFHDRTGRALITIHNNVKVLNNKIEALDARLPREGDEAPIILSEWYGVCRIYRDLYRVDHVPRQGLLSSAISKSLDSFLFRSRQGQFAMIVDLAGKPSKVWHISVVKPWFDAVGYQMIEDHFARNMPADRAA